MIGKWHNLPAEFPEMADPYSIECIGRIFSVCLSGNWIDWLRLLKGYSPSLGHESHAVSNSKEPTSITNARSALDGLFNHLKVDFIKNSL